jgi:hypothetical protein
MFCPTCNAQNLATDVRCLQCRALLIETTEKRSDAYIRSNRDMDNRIYSGVGALIGFGFVGLSLKFFLSNVNMNDEQIYSAAAIGAAVGGMLGRYISHKKWSEY